MTIMALVSFQFDAMPGSEEMQKRTMKLRDEFELLVDASLKRNMLRRKSPWAGVKCILAASNFLALPTPDRAAVLDLS